MSTHGWLHLGLQVSARLAVTSRQGQDWTLTRALGELGR